MKKTRVLTILMPITLFASYRLQAQPPSTTAPPPTAVQPAPPPATTTGGPQRVSAKIALPVAPRDPWGVALHGGVPTVRLGGTTLGSNYIGGRTESGSVRVEWGATLDDLQATLGDLPSFHVGNFDQPGDKALSCTPENDGSNTCFPDPGAPWYVDFGQSSIGAVSPFVTFAPDGRFFRYFATFRTDSFDEIYQTLVKRFGTPSSHKHSSVQNRMGASFSQETANWATPHTQVTLQRRGTNVDEGMLSVVYLPIAKELPKKPEANSPM
jgi:hypothetical protein